MHTDTCEISNLWKFPIRKYISGLLWHLECLQPSDTKFVPFSISGLRWHFSHFGRFWTFQIPLSFRYIIMFRHTSCIWNVTNHPICIISKVWWHFPFPFFLELFTFQGFCNILENVRLGPKNAYLTIFKDFSLGPASAHAFIQCIRKLVTIWNLSSYIFHNNE